jgi:type IV pilus assembly protein PilN
MRFDINLASQPYQDVQRFMVRWGLALLALGLITVGLVYAAASAFVSWRASETQTSQLRDQVAERAREKAAIESALNRNSDARDKAQFLNALIARKAFSWTEVLSDLEKLVPPTLHVRAIHPEINEDGQLEVRLSVAGSSREGTVELVRRLEQSSHFMQSRILSESTAKATLNQGPSSTPAVQFEISAIYLPTFARPEMRPGSSIGKPSPEAQTEARNGRH